MCRHLVTVVEGGMNVCVQCGVITGRHLDTASTSFNHKVGPPRQQYSRANRYRKLLQRLQGKTGNVVEASLMYEVQTK